MMGNPSAQSETGDRDECLYPEVGSALRADLVIFIPQPPNRTSNCVIANKPTQLKSPG
jgi:hypothetical protein